MTTRVGAPPILPQAPRNYDVRHMDALISALNFWLQQINNPGNVRATTVTITDIPTSSAGLEPGTLWHDTVNGVVKVAT